MNPPFGTRREGADVMFLEVQLHWTMHLPYNVDGVKMEYILAFPFLVDSFTPLSPPKAAYNCCNRAVYSMHKSSTRNYVMKKAKQLGAKASVLAELRFDIPKTHSIHRKNTIDVKVDLVRLEKSGING